MKRIIINADDYGLTKGVSSGIIELYKKKKISSCSVMANCEDREWHFKRLLRYGIPSGIHLNLSAGRPISPPDLVHTLVDDEGNFISAETLLIRERIGKIDYDHIKLELKAQVMEMRKYIEPDHFDGHRHFYFFSQRMREIVFSLMSSLGIMRTRIPYEGKLFHDSSIYFILRTAFLNKFSELAYKSALAHGFRFPKYFRGQQYTGNWSKKRLLNIMRSSIDSTEIMIHPGYSDKKLRSISSLNDCREKELRLFLNAKYYQDIMLSSFESLLD